MLSLFTTRFAFFPDRPAHLCLGKLGRLFVVATLQMWGLVAEFERESLDLRIHTVLVAAFSVGLPWSSAINSSRW